MADFGLHGGYNRGYSTPPTSGTRDCTAAILGGKNARERRLRVYLINTAVVRMAVGRRYSGYYEQLKDDVKKRYNEKLNIIGEAVDDPYTFSSGLGIDAMPNIEYPDIYNFLINTPSPYTKEELKAYKSFWRVISI